MTEEQKKLLVFSALAAAVAAMDVVQGAYGAAWPILTRALEESGSSEEHNEVREILQRVQTDLGKVRNFFRRTMG